ncbi:hypothetical protein CROQUDRAFT_655773 [Cronartium quercuum f. sp. fusiforme G11]|uniref:Uncharacterized protein n=1 Tax=Cronartium quercuum f. sp. fusiforme G11 TaxID=708437 RepID=A0A9P6NP81_9BASI|nr:hypothetical protein CROQUDRAFT_655773 [Cronartium quercuum f. sp. fusiforme G11]
MSACRPAIIVFVFYEVHGGGLCFAANFREKLSMMKAEQNLAEGRCLLPLGGHGG